MIFDKARIQLYRNLIINVSQILPLFQFEQSTFGAHRPWCFNCTKLNPHLTSIFYTNLIIFQFLRLGSIWGSLDDNQANMEMPMY
jgi:hypothetical protein